MKTFRLVPLAIVFFLLTTLAVTAGAPETATLNSGGCIVGGGYDPACDVDHDGDIDIDDIQLTAGHWSETGTFTSDNDHDHLNQVWEGVNNSLVINGTFGSFPDNFAPLVLDNPDGHGLWVKEAGARGVQVNSAGSDGVRVGIAGNPSNFSNSDAENGFEVAGAQGYGLYVGHANYSGVFVNAAGEDGVNVWSAVRNGLTVNADGHGLYVFSVGEDGVRINSASHKGVNVVGAGEDGVYANTQASNGEWGLVTPDKISGSNITLSSVTVVAQVTGDQALTAGDVVAAVGVTDPLPDSNISLAMVRPADSTSFTGIVGVVEGRMALTPQRQLEDEKGQEPVLELRSAEGPAQPGDYVALTVLGVAQVKIDTGADIQPGQKLTASDVAGQARALKTVEVEGVRLAEDTPSIGIALAAPEPGQDTIPVFITLR
ncbi:MAG: hypothetical protein U9R25_12280 [Chloroflexota bacterium]|nr:hypothetical protein [Chloroflexota bacterium]